MRHSQLSAVATIGFWLFGAPAAFLGTLYVGTLPFVALGPPEARGALLDLAVGSYSGLLFVVALYFSWSCWRAVRGEAPDVAFRPFPWWIWVGTAALGLAAGAFSGLRGV